MSAPVTAAVARTLAVIEALAGHSFDGRRLKDVMDAVRQSGPTTLKDLQALESLGYAQRIPGRDDRWRLAPRLVRLAHAHQAEMARLRQRVDDTDHNYTRA